MNSHPSSTRTDGPAANANADASSVLRGTPMVLRDGSAVVVRPIHPDDIELERRFIEGLSPDSRRFRFLESLRSPSLALLQQMTVIDPSTDAAYVAVIEEGERQREVGVARFSAPTGCLDAEFAVTVSDDWQNRGLGTLLMDLLIDVARKRGLAVLHSSDAAHNAPMRRFAEHRGYRHQRDPDDAKLVRYSIDLKSTPGPAAVQPI